LYWSTFNIQNAPKQPSVETISRLLEHNKPLNRTSSR
jgi:hypothetical protein